MLDKIICVKQQYLNPFYCVPKLNYCYYIVILGTIDCVQMNEVFNRIISLK